MSVAVSYQPAIPGLDDLRERAGVVYTKAWVVELILTLVGYTADKALFNGLLLEPSAGDGSFLCPIVERLVRSCQRHGVPLERCIDSLAAYELDPYSAESARQAIVTTVKRLGVDPCEAERLARQWVRCADYLLEADEYNGRADWVVGNPPYIRLEDLDEGGALYRNAYRTMIGRADIYVAFFEAALRHLKPGGVCSFICADRWMFNQYGSELRSLVTSKYSVQAIIQMHHADAFDSEVSAYPAVTVLRRQSQGAAVVASMAPEAERIGGQSLADLIHDVMTTGTAIKAQGVAASRVSHWFQGGEPWPHLGPAQIALLDRLEATFPTLEESGCKVGIGVATGADKVFITKDRNLVEPDRLLPLAMAFDVKGARVEWSGHYLVNPWNGKGQVDLQRYPRLAAYLETHRPQLSGRHIGKKVPANWFRTIDRVNMELTTKQKLYLPDFSDRIAPVLDRGQTYPHHNVYFIEPGEAWDPEVLGGLLLSDVAQFFMEAYGLRMRGGYIRFQAQYLRRICVPSPEVITSQQGDELRQAFKVHDVETANRIANELYGIDASKGE